MTATFQMEVEYTDTFGGEANYCWVKRETLTLPVGISDRAIMRRAKAAMGLTGARGRSEQYGDGLRFVPYGSCTVMFTQALPEEMPDPLAEIRAFITRKPEANDPV